MREKTKKAQEQKSKTLVALPKKAQEEMVGFALIVIIVSVILVIFLGFSLRDQGKENVESYEVESFIQSFLQYTSECRDNFDFLSVQELISDCNNNKKCSDGKKVCDILNETLKGITGESWKIGKERPVNGYELKINSLNKNILEFKEGNTTGNSKGAIQYLPNNIEITFTAYY